MSSTCRPVRPPYPTGPNRALRLEADGSYTESSDALAFTIAKVERPGLALDAIISLGNLATSPDLKLNGSLTYDLAKLTPKLSRAGSAAGLPHRARGAHRSLSRAASPHPHRWGPGVGPLPPRP